MVLLQQPGACWCESKDDLAPVARWDGQINSSEWPRAFGQRKTPYRARRTARGAQNRKARIDAQQAPSSDCRELRGLGCRSHDYSRHRQVGRDRGSDDEIPGAIDGHAQADGGAGNGV